VNVVPFKNIESGGIDSYTIIDLGYKFYLPPVENPDPFSSSLQSRPVGDYYYPAVAIYTGGNNILARFTLTGSESDKDIQETMVKVSWLEVLVNTGRTRKELTRTVKKHTKLLRTQVVDPRQEEVIAEFNWGDQAAGAEWKIEWHEGQDEAK